MQEWRARWWRIYRLDTYSNLASGTPYLIDDTAINTSLNLRQTKSASQGILLPNTEDLFDLLSILISDSETLLNNFHNITVAIMRQAGLVIRMHMLQRQDGILAQVANVERQLNTLRLALPSGWLNPRRNAFSNETPVDHHARLITVFHLRMAQLLISVVGCGQKRADGGLLSWQRVLETCQDIASLAGQWDSAYCSFFRQLGLFSRLVNDTILVTYQIVHCYFFFSSW